jgi:hypothetical protein
VTEEESVLLDDDWPGETTEVFVIDDDPDSIDVDVDELPDDLALLN